MIRALAFDFDGLILDTEGPIFKSWQELCQSYDYQLTLEDWEICLGSAEGTSIFFDNLEQGASDDPDDDDVIYVTTFGGSVFRGPAAPTSP